MEAWLNGSGSDDSVLGKCLAARVMPQHAQSNEHITQNLNSVNVDAKQEVDAYKNWEARLSEPSVFRLIGSSLGVTQVQSISSLQGQKEGKVKSEAM